MTDKTILFDRPLAHRNDPITSYEAADKMVKSGALNRQEEGVYNDMRRYIIDCFHKDVTARELAEWCISNDYYTIQHRLSGLHNKGKIERVQSGLRSVRSGNLIPKKRDGCCVWRLKGE